MAVVVGLLSVYKNIEKNKGLSIETINKLTQITMGDIEKLLKNDQLDLSKVDKEKQSEILNLIKKSDLIDFDNINKFIEQGKNLQGISKEIYTGIIYDKYKENPDVFIKNVLKLNEDDMSKVFKNFTDKYIEKPKVIDDLQKILNNKNLNEDDKKKLDKVIKDLKNN